MEAAKNFNNFCRSKPSTRSGNSLKKQTKIPTPMQFLSPIKSSSCIVIILTPFILTVKFSEYWHYWVTCIGINENSVCQSYFIVSMQQQTTHNTRVPWIHQARFFKLFCLPVITIVMKWAAVWSYLRLIQYFVNNLANLVTGLLHC